ncbi:hypothetical protein A7K94_0215605 [Modestobacter sp. VKM Ac-2676]|nr:hypothetical protein A7K94_0215605 [Modestobacter sp. VKM Ac-2676]
MVRCRRRGEHAALERLGQLPLLPEQPGLLQGRTRPATDLHGGVQLRLGVRRPAGTGVDPQRAEGLPAGHQGDDDAGLRLQPGQQRARLRVGASARST